MAIEVGDSFFLCRDTIASYGKKFGNGPLVAEKKNHNYAIQSHIRLGFSMNDAFKHCPILANSRTLLSDTVATSMWYWF